MLYGWPTTIVTPAKAKVQGGKPHHRGQGPNRNHSAGNGKPQGAKPQSAQAPKRDGGGQQAPRRSGGGSSWMTDLGKRQA